MSVKEEVRSGRIELGSDLDPDPWKILWIWIHGKYYGSGSSKMMRILCIRIPNTSKPEAPPPPTHPKAELVYSVPWCCTLQSMKTEKKKGRPLPLPLKFHYFMVNTVRSHIFANISAN